MSADNESAPLRRTSGTEVGQGESDADGHQEHHEQGLALVHILEQPVQDYDQEDEDDVRDEAGQNAEAVRPLGGGDVVSGGGGVPENQERGEEKLADDGYDHEQEVERACSPRGRVR